MSIEISKSIDIEDAIRTALDPYLTVYCRPLPKDFSVPCILINQVGGTTDATNTGKGKVDTFNVVLDSRAEIEADAVEYMNTAVAILEQSKQSGFSYVAVNSLYSWGADPVRPDLAMCSSTLQVTAHRTIVTLE